MLGRRFLLLCIIIFLISFASSEAGIPTKLPSAVIVGTVYCDTCFRQDFSKSSHFISGASVAVQCGDENSKPSFREVTKTNKHGEFKVNLPLSVSKHVKKIKGCSVKLISSSESYCAVASTATSSSIHLKSRKDGTHVFSAGFFTFKPLKQPELCNQKPSVPKPKKPLNIGKLSSISYPNAKFLPPIQDPPSSDLPPFGQYLPPLPQLPHPLPLPELPPLPTLPGLPTPPVPAKSVSKNSRRTTQLSDEKVVRPKIFNPIPLPPNPLLPPPSIIPPFPNPLQPPPSILPPVFPSPPPSIFPPLFPSPPPSIFPPIIPSPPKSPPSIFPPIIPSPPTPPPSIFPPIIPSPPTPPPSTFPPIFPVPISPPSFPFPPLIPGLTPSPPPPPPPFFRFPLPPFPFQPTPGFPGVPPAIPSPSASDKSSP